MLNQIIEQTKTKFFELKQDYIHHYESSHGFTKEDGTVICFFWNKKKCRAVGCYLKNNILMPYFGIEE